MRLTEMKIIYSTFRADEVSVHRARCERATQHYSLGGELRSIPAQDQQVLPHVVQEW